MKNLQASPLNQVSVNLTLIAIIALAILLVIASAVQPWVDARWLYMDTQTAGELSGDCCHIYDGAISTLGIMIWAATAAIGLLTTLVLIFTNQRKAMMFALQAAIVSGIMAIDDAYLLHEVAFPKLGIPQIAVLAGIALILALYLIANVRRLLSIKPWLLALSLICFAFSLGVDQIAHSIETTWIVLEDGAKFIGIVCWYLFHQIAFANLLLPREQSST